MIVIHKIKTKRACVLQVSHLSKSYVSDAQSVNVLKDVSFTLESGKSLSIQGPSGCGKSTLLHLIGALDSPDSGSITLDTNTVNTLAVNALAVDRLAQNRDSAKPEHIKVDSLSEQQADTYRRKHVGFVFQKYNLIDCISVHDNILLPSQLNRIDANAFISELVQTLGIAEHMHKLPTQLSGGQQQRVAIARALAHQPQLILADEPTGNLDEDNSCIVSELLYESCKTMGTSLIVVTHSNTVAGQANMQMHMQHKHLVA